MLIIRLLERRNGDSSIFYMQWYNSDYCSLIEQEPDFADFADFIEDFIKKLFRLISHHYIAEQQPIFFMSLKENL